MESLASIETPQMSIGSRSFYGSMDSIRTVEATANMQQRMKEEMNFDHFFGEAVESDFGKSDKFIDF
jgi:hypothetical protein